MKANELLIGDWVLDTLTKEPIKVDEACIRHAEYRERTGQGEIVEPMPLTEDVFKANRFLSNRNKTEFTLVLSDGYQLCVSKSSMYAKKGVLTRFWLHDLKLDYVHELQHTLREVGMEVLAHKLIVKEMRRILYRVNDERCIEYNKKVRDAHLDVANMMIDTIIDPTRKEREDRERECLVYADHFEISTRTDSDFKHFYFRAEIRDITQPWADFYKTDGDYRR